MPVPVALVEVWARRAPLSGLRCSGLVVGDVLVTARHCVGGRLLVVTGSLCDVETAGVALTVPPAGPAPPRPSDDDLAPLPLPLRGLAPPPLRRGTPPRLRHGTPPRLAAAREGADAIVVGYGIGAMDGRVACLPASFRGTLRRCAAPGAWCLAAPPRGQLCGGSSGAPVLVEAGDGWDLAGVVSGGPRCGQAGDVVVATTG